MAARTPTPCRRIILDRDGDLTLFVGLEPNLYEFLVCSRALTRSSPVFKAMLTGSHRWKEYRPDDSSEPWAVSLPDDSPQPAKVLLRIVHGRFDKVPRQLASHEHALLLHGVLSLADKYDMTKVLQPWAQSWVSSLPALKACWPLWPGLGIALEFGLEDKVRKFVKRIVTEGICTEDGSIGLETETEGAPTTVDPGDGSISLAHAELLDHALKVRHELLSEMLGDNLRPMFNGLSMAVKHKADRHCKMVSSVGRLLCEVRSCNTNAFAMLGSTAHSGLGLPSHAWSGHCEILRRDTDTMKSIAKILGELEEASVDVESFFKFSCFHSECNPIAQLLAKFKKIVAEKEEKWLPEKTIDYMAKKRVIFGDLDVPE